MAPRVILVLFIYYSIYSYLELAFIFSFHLIILCNRFQFCLFFYLAFLFQFLFWYLELFW